MIVIRHYIKKYFSSNIIQINIIYFLIPIFILISLGTRSQVLADFTTINSNTGCGELVVEFQDLSSGNPTNWLWEFGNGMTSTLQNPIAVFSDTGSYTVTLTISNSLSHNSLVRNEYIKVFGNPEVLVTQDHTSFCVPDEVMFIDETIFSNSIVSWTWDFGDGGSSNIQHPIYAYQNPGDFTVSLSVIDDKGCSNIIVYNNLINAKKFPVADFGTDINFSCNLNESVSFFNNSDFSSSYLWDFGDGSSSVIENPSNHYSNGLFDVRLIASNGICADTLIKNSYIEIGATINTDFTSLDSLICVNDSIIFQDNTDIIPDTWIWDFGDGTVSGLQNPSHIYNSPGSYTITLTTFLDSNCIDTKEMINFVQVLDVPYIDLDINDSIFCEFPSSLIISDNTPNIDVWEWKLNNNIISNISNDTININQYGFYELTLKVTDSNGCISYNHDKNIIVDSINVIFETTDSVICDGGLVNFLNLSHSNFPITSYNWDFGNGTFSNHENPQTQYSGVSIFDVSLEIENSIGCLKQVVYPSLIKTIDVPIIDFDVDNIISCAGNDINFLSVTIPSSLLFWDWSFGDGNSSNQQNPSHQYNNVGIYDVSLVAGEGQCMDTILKNNFIEIIEPSADFKVDFNCDNPYLVEFTNLSIGADEILWNFGDGTFSTDYNPIHIFTNRGFYDISLTVTNFSNSCSHTFKKEIRVTEPVANFDYFVKSSGIIDSVVCIPDRVHIKNLSQDCRNYRIDWGDGIIGINRVDHVYDSVGTFDVTLMMTDFHGCKDTISKSNMFRGADVESNFQINSMVGCDSLTVDFYDLSSVFSNVIWDFGDGNSSIINNPQHTYIHEGIYDVTLFSKSFEGCKDTVTINQIVKFDKLDIEFNVSDSDICVDTDFLITNNSSGIPVSYYWDFGDGNTSNSMNSIYSYNNPGIYSIIFSVTDTFSCNLIDSVSIQVQDVSADFLSSSQTSTCPPMISNFTDNSIGNIVSYYWDFGDGNYSSQQNPSHLYEESGLYDVKLIIEDDFSCIDTLIIDNLINISGPIGDFVMSSNIICKDQYISFTPQVINANNYLWDFGDGNYSIDYNPSNSYYNAGVYFPKLIVDNGSNCQLIIHPYDSIFVSEVILDAGYDQTICLGDSISLYAFGTANNFNWLNLVNISNNSIPNPIVFPDSTTYFIVENYDGFCTSIDSVLVIVDDSIPIPSFTFENQCINDSLKLIASDGLISNNMIYEWSIIGENLYSSSVYFQFDTIGIFPVRLELTNLDNNCKSAIIQNIEIYPLPEVDFLYNDVCFGEKVYLENISDTTIIEFLWDFGDFSQFSNQISPNHLFNNSGNFIISLYALSNNECVNSISKDLIVHTPPLFEIEASEVCLTDHTYFSANLDSNKIKSYNWDFGDNTIMSENVSPIHKYNSDGVFTVYLIVEDEFGCIKQDSVDAIVYPIPAIDFDIIRTCEGDITQFIDQSSVSSGLITQYYWEFSNGYISNLKNPSFIFDSSGLFSFILEVVSESSCVSKQRNELIIHSNPEVNFIIDSIVCEGMEVNLTNLSKSDSEIENYFWMLGDQSFSNLENPKNIYNYSGFYNISLEIEDEYGCKGKIIKDSVIYVSENPESTFDVSNSNVSLFDSKVTFFNTSDTNLFFEWDFDNGSLDSTNNEVDIYFDYIGQYNISLYVENNYGCIDEMSHTINVVEDLNLFIPNSFTPNFDGTNDVFIVEGSAIESFEMKIYNRWGELVFETFDINIGWDGYSYNGKLLEKGLYLYNISINNESNQRKIYNGEVNLLR